MLTRADSLAQRPGTPLAPLAPEPHKSHWHDKTLFLRCRIEDCAFTTKWGPPEALDTEFERRQADEKRRKEAKIKDKLLDLKVKTTTDSFRRNLVKHGQQPARFGDAIGGLLNGWHVHDWCPTVENSVKTCLTCGMEVEELEF